MNSVSDCYYGIAAAAWEGKNYEKSAKFWYKSWLLDSERQEAVEWYWHSKNKLQEQTADSPEA